MIVEAIAAEKANVPCEGLRLMRPMVDVGGRKGGLAERRCAAIYKACERTVSPIQTSTLYVHNAELDMPNNLKLSSPNIPTSLDKFSSNVEPVE